MRLIAIATVALPALCCGQGLAQEGAALLAKAHNAFIENREHDRYWNWTTITTRSVLDKLDRVLEELPSVTIESPINSKGRRCNAVLAWGDGTEPYLSKASADERCAVETETPGVFSIDALLQSKQVKIQSRSATGIVLAIRPDKTLVSSTDLTERCIASLEATVTLDPATSFPKRVEIHVPDNGCNQSQASVANHYDDTVLAHVKTGFNKGTLLRYEFELRKDKSGGGENRNYWIRTRTHTVRPLEKNANAILVSGRQFPMLSQGPDRRLVVDSRTSASELSAESTVTFEPEKDK